MSIQWTQTTTTFAILVVVPVSLALLAKLFPDKFNRMPTEAEFSTREVAKWNSLALILFFLFTAIFCFTIWKLTFSLYKLTVPYTNQLVYIGMPEISFCLPALFLAIILSYIPISFILKRILKDRYQLYMTASTRQFGPTNYPLIMKGLSILIVAGFFITNTYLFNAKILLSDESFSICGMVSCEKINYKQLMEIGVAEKFKAPNGNMAVGRNFYFKLSDGKINSPMLFRRHENIEAIARLISEKSGLELKRVEILPEEQ